MVSASDTGLDTILEMDTGREPEFIRDTSKLTEPPSDGRWAKFKLS